MVKRQKDIKDQETAALDNEVSSVASLAVLGDRILLIPSDEDGERATRGGLVIPATAENERLLRWGEVISTGPNARHVSAGDRVLYAPDSGYDAEIAGDAYLILRERDIHGVVEQPGTPKTGMYL